jgi:hypothetical protein
MKTFFLFILISLISFSFSYDSVKLVSKCFKKSIVAELSISDTANDVDDNDDSDSEDECCKIKFDTFTLISHQPTFCNTLHNFGLHSEPSASSDYSLSIDFPPEVI